MKDNKSSFTIIYILLFFLVFFCNSLFAQEQKIINVSLGWHSNTEFSGIYTAQKYGLYKKLGLKVNIVDNQSKDSETILQNNAQVFFRSQHRIMNDRLKGVPIKAFAAKFQVTPNCIMTAKNGRIKNPKDFKGKSLGYHYDSDLNYYKVFLSKQKIKLSSVNFVKMNSFDTHELIQLFKSKKIDALIAWQTNWPVKFSLLHFPVKVFSLYQSGFSLYGNMYAASEEYIANNKELLKKFLMATNKGWAIAFSHPKEIATYITLNYYPKDKYINGSYPLTLKHQISKLILSKQFLLEGVGIDYLGLVSQARLTASIDFAKKYQIIPSSAKISAEDFYSSEIIHNLYGARLQ